MGGIGESSSRPALFAEQYFHAVLHKARWRERGRIGNLNPHSTIGKYIAGPASGQLHEFQRPKSLALYGYLNPGGEIDIVHLSQPDPLVAGRLRVKARAREFPIHRRKTVACSAALGRIGQNE